MVYLNCVREWNYYIHKIMEGIYKNQLQAAALAVLILLSIFLSLVSAGELVSLRYIGAGIAATNTITVSGKGEVFATPDIATFSYSVNEERDTVAAAQEAAAKKTNDILAYLKKSGVAEKDIQTGGYNVYPREVEQVIETHPGIGQVVVLSLPDEQYGEAVHAVISCRDPALRREDLLQLCRSTLANYKVPKSFRVVQTFALLPNGKIDRVGTRAMAATLAALE